MDILRIDRDVLPPEEHPAARAIERNMAYLQILAEEFRQAADLYYFARNREKTGQDDPRRMGSWIKLAGRNGAMTANSISEIMQGTAKIKAPIIRQKQDIVNYKRAKRLFIAEFPQINEVRDSAAHPGELIDSPEKLDEHRLTKRATLHHISVEPGGYVGLVMKATNDGVHIATSFKGRMVGYELSMQKADVLDEVAKLYCRSFYPLENAAASGQRGH